MTDPASLSLQITRCCPRKSRAPPFDQSHPLLAPSISLFGWRPTPDGRVKTFELFMFFSASPQLQCGMQMHLLFCHPFECLMSAHRQNCAVSHSCSSIPPRELPPFLPPSLSLSLSLIWSANRGQSKSGRASINEVKKAPSRKNTRKIIP